MNATEEREFDLGDVLTVVTGNLVSERGMRGVYEILAFMAGEDIYTHQIGRALREAAPVILGLHPQLVGVEAIGVTRENHKAWLAERVAKFGARLSVRRMTAAEHERIDPLSELSERFHPDRIVVVSK